VEAAGGTAGQATDAAAISFQNTMGSVCDLVHGIVEIPCHTRNAVAASSAFVCADLILGGYENPIPLDETIDAVYAVGRMLPAELRCTALGGLAVLPSAKALRRLRCHPGSDASRLPARQASPRRTTVGTRRPRQQRWLRQSSPAFRRRISPSVLAQSSWISIIPPSHPLACGRSAGRPRAQTRNTPARSHKSQRVLALEPAASGPEARCSLILG